MSSHLSLFSAFLRRPRKVGAIVPTATRAARRVCRVMSLAVESPQVVVEYGPGNGAITRELLRPGMLPSSAKLVALELEFELFNVLSRKFDDPRLYPVLGDAAGAGAVLSRVGVDSADVVISGIPLSVMTARERRELLQHTHSIIRPGGAFIAYQYHGRIGGELKKIFGNVKTEWFLPNIPPLCVLSSQKPA